MMRRILLMAIKMNSAFRKAESRTAKNKTSFRPKSRNPGFGKSEVQTAEKRTEIILIRIILRTVILIHLSIHQRQRKLKRRHGGRHNYPLLATSYMNNNPDYIPKLISYVQCSTAPYLKLGSETMPMPKMHSALTPTLMTLTSTDTTMVIPERFMDRYSAAPALYTAMNG